MKTKTIRALPKLSQDDIDGALIRKVAEGDRDAFDTLYFDYHRRLSRFLLRFSSHYPLVEEVINDTMFCVWKQAREFRGASKVSTWIMGIAFRQASNMLRGIERARKREERATDTVSAPAENEIDRHARIEWVTAALEALPVEQRAAIELAYVLGHSCAEIAEICDCPVGTVKSRMLAARAALQRSLPALAGDRDAR